MRKDYFKSEKKNKTQTTISTSLKFIPSDVGLIDVGLIDLLAMGSHETALLTNRSYSYICVISMVNRNFVFVKRKIVTNILDRSLWLVWYPYLPYRCGRSVPFVPSTVFRWGKLVELKGPGRDLDFINRLLFLGYQLSDGSDGTFQERQTHSLFSSKFLW